MQCSLFLLSLTGIIGLHPGTTGKQENVALKKNATQSSIYKNESKHAATSAIDGNRTCAHTKEESDPWWRVDLQDVYRVTAVVIDNDGSCCLERLEGAEIHIGNSLKNNGNNNPSCPTIVHVEKKKKTYCDETPLMGRYINVFLPGRSNIPLVLCEVEVYGSDSPLVLVKKNKTWVEALDYCREHHYDLVSIQDEDTQAWAKQEGMQANTPYVWLGLHYTCTLDFWFWVSGESSCYANWAPGNGAGGEECGMTGAMERNGENRWVALPDSRRLNFICEEEVEPSGDD